LLKNDENLFLRTLQIRRHFQFVQKNMTIYSDLSNSAQEHNSYSIFSLNNMFLLGASHSSKHLAFFFPPGLGRGVALRLALPRPSFFSTAAGSDLLGKHHEEPDDPSAEYEISYTLSPLKLKEFPAKLSNFQAGKDSFECLVLNGNKEQSDVYVDKNAMQLFEAIFPEIVESRRIGKIGKQHFDTWDYREEPEPVLLERAFSLIDRDQNGTIERSELDAIMIRSGLGMNDDLFGAIDKDGSGEIDLGEFQEYWKSSKYGVADLGVLGDAF
jgi:hypothetical protein